MKKIVLNHEDQLSDFSDMRRSIKGSVWHFLSEGEGMMAELSALQKLESQMKRSKDRNESLAAVLRREALGDKDVKEMSMADYQKSVLAKSAKKSAMEESPAGSADKGKHGKGAILTFAKDVAGGDEQEGGESPKRKSKSKPKGGFERLASDESEPPDAPSGRNRDEGGEPGEDSGKEVS